MENLGLHAIFLNLLPAFWWKQKVTACPVPLRYLSKPGPLMAVNRLVPCPI
jgi:hypothetical protein